MVKLLTSSQGSYTKRVFQVLPELGEGLLLRVDDLCVLFHQLGEVREQRMLLTEEVKMVVPLESERGPRFHLQGKVIDGTRMELERYWNRYIDGTRMELERYWNKYKG